LKRKQQFICKRKRSWWLFDGSRSKRIRKRWIVS